MDANQSMGVPDQLRATHRQDEAGSQPIVAGIEKLDALARAGDVWRDERGGLCRPATAVHCAAARSTWRRARVLGWPCTVVPREDPLHAELAHVKLLFGTPIVGSSSRDLVMGTSITVAAHSWPSQVPRNDFVGSQLLAHNMRLQ